MSSLQLFSRHSRLVHPFTNLAVIFSILPLHLRRLIVCLVPLMLLTAFLEMLVIALTIPLIEQFSSRDSNYLSPLNYFFNYFGDSKLFLLISLYCILILTSSISKIFTLKFSTILSSQVGIETSCLAFKNIISQDYQLLISASSSSYINSITTGATLAAISFSNLLQLSTAISLVSIVICTMLLVNTFVTVSLILLLCSAYYLFSIKSLKLINRNSVVISASNSQAIQLLQESLGSIRDIIMGNHYDIFIQNYTNIDKRFRETQAANDFLSQYPKHCIESIGYLLLVLLGLYLSLFNQSQLILPLIGFVAVSFQRLLPACQGIYSSFTNIISLSSHVDALVSIIKNKPSPRQPISSTFIFKSYIALTNVSYSYPETSSPVLRETTIFIPKHSVVGIVGSSGGGKSTLLDILMGLLLPSEGQLVIDDKSVIKYYPDKRPHHTSNYEVSWQSLFSHVPQDTFLLDSSILSNILFDQPSNDINQEHFNYVAKAACVSDFALQLPNNYNTRVGERGSLLSGGQRQRISIARALYQRKPILVLDEATSAMDKLTEERVLTNITKLYWRPTVIIISHEKSILPYCDKVYKIINNRTCLVQGESSYLENTQ